MKSFIKRPQLNQNTIVLIRHIVAGLLVIAAVGLFVSVVWYGTRLQIVTISEVSVSGGETIALGEIKKNVEAELEGAYLGLIPKRFTWFYPHDQIVAVVSEVPRIHNVQVQHESSKRIAVTFDEYIPRALWCESVDSSNCLFLDKTGYAFATAPTLTGGSLLRFIEVGQEPELHTSIASEVLVNEAVALVELLAEHEWQVSHVEVGHDGVIFMRLVGGGELKVDLNLPPADTVANLFVILGSDEFSHLKPGNFQYIDLRFGNKVYVNEEPVVSEAEDLDQGVLDEQASSTDSTEE